MMIYQHLLDFYLGEELVFLPQLNVGGNTISALWLDLVMFNYLVFLCSKLRVASIDSYG
jgi:hypothetical protein